MNSSRTYLWAKSYLWADNLQPIGKESGILGKCICEPRLAKEEAGGAGKETLSANEARNVFLGTTPQYSSPTKRQKNKSGTLPYPDFLEFHSLAPTPQLQVELDEGGVHHFVSQC